MDIEVSNCPLSGAVQANSSKSWLHRALICAALYGNATVIAYRDICEDVKASIACLRALGWSVTAEKNCLHIGARNRSASIKELPCRESASTLRFFICMAAALAEECRFKLAGRLPCRPLQALLDELSAHGYSLSGQGSGLLCGKGKLQPGEYTLPGDISSQYISGLLMALPALSGESRLILSSRPESSPYIALTLRVLSLFGVQISINGNNYHINSAAKEKRDSSLQTEGDWTSAAVWLSAAALSGSKLTVTGLSHDSAQGDKAICGILSRFGANVIRTQNGVTVEGGKLNGICIDGADTPDLVPVLAAVATAAHGETTIYNVARLRLKESDRLQAISGTLQTLGARVQQTNDALTIHGGEKLIGGRVSACGDHRIAMMAAICAARCNSAVTVCGAEAVSKSYPGFFEELRQLQH